MKNTYIIPKTIVVKLTSAASLLTGSLTTTGATFYKENATGAAMGRESNSWDIWENGSDDFED